MSLTKEEILAFVEENVVLEKVNGKIVINVIKADVQTVEGSVSWVDGHVDRAASVRWVHGHVDRASSVRLIEGHVDRAASARRVEGRVDKAGSVRWVSNEESES